MIDGDAVVHEIVLAAPPAEVFRFFVEPDRLVRWIGLSADLSPVAGGRFRFEIEPGEWCEGTYVSIEPLHRVVFTWGWVNPIMEVPPGSSTVEVTLAEHDGGTLLRLVHRDLGDGRQRPMHDEGWTHFLGRLRGEVDSGRR